jgi:hypothetical protein
MKPVSDGFAPVAKSRICHFGSFDMLRINSGRNRIFQMFCPHKISRFARNDIQMGLFTKPSMLNWRSMKMVPAESLRWESKIKDNPGFCKLDFFSP